MLGGLIKSCNVIGSRQSDQNSIRPRFRVKRHCVRLYWSSGGEGRLRVLCEFVCLCLDAAVLLLWLFGAPGVALLCSNVLAAALPVSSGHSTQHIESYMVLWGCPQKLSSKDAQHAICLHICSSRVVCMQRFLAHVPTHVSTEWATASRKGAAPLTSCRALGSMQTQ